MSLSSAVARGREAAERQMRDEFTAYGAPTWVKVDGLDEETRPERYTTPGKLQGSSKQRATTQTRYVTVGGVERPVVEGGLHIPYGKPLPAEGWEFECSAVGDPINAFRIGRRWRVVAVPLDDATARRLDVVEIPQEAP